MKTITKYEVERVNVNKDGIITYTDSVDKSSTLVDTYEEALKVAEDIDARGYDQVLINKLTLEYDEEWDEIIETIDSEQVESYKVNRHGFAVTEKKVYVVNHIINAQANDRGMSDRVETLIETEDEDEARKLYEVQGEGYELIAEVREWLIGADDYDITDEEVIDEK